MHEKNTAPLVVVVVVVVVDRTKTLQKKAFFAWFIMREKPFLFVWSIAFMRARGTIISN